MVGFGQNNYGNFQANQYSGAANSSVILGSLPSATPTARFYINTTTQNAAEINVTGSYLNGLRVTTSGLIDSEQYKSNHDRKNYQL